MLLLYVCVVALQGLYLAGLFPEGGYAFCGCRSSGYRSDVRYLVFDGGLSDIGIIVLTLLSGRSIDNKLNVTVLDIIKDIRPSFVQFQDALRIYCML